MFIMEAYFHDRILFQRREVVAFGNVYVWLLCSFGFRMLERYRSKKLNPILIKKDKKENNLYVKAELYQGGNMFIFRK